MTFEFIPVTPAHFPILMQWHQRPHVLENWNDFSSYEDMCASYEEKISNDFVFPFLVSLNGKPFGYIQAYQAWKVGDGWWPNEQEHSWGIDQFIGEEKFVGKGLGPKFMDQFIQNVLAARGCERVIVDPTPGNASAIRAYEKAGFKAEGVVTTPDGEALLMVRNLGPVS